MWSSRSSSQGGESAIGDQKFSCKREKCKGVLTPIGSVRSHIDDLIKAKQRAVEATHKGVKLTHGCCLSCKYVSFTSFIFFFLNV